LKQKKAKARNQNHCAMSKTLKSNRFSPLFPPFDIIKNLSKKHAWENTYNIIKTVKTDFSGKT